MKELKLEDQIYLCKYHDVDKHLYHTLRINEEEVDQIIKYLKKRGLYEQYRNLSDDEYENLIKKRKNVKKEQKGKNQLLDLNDMLFKQLNIIMDDSLTENELNEEIKRSKQVVSLSQTIINNADLLLRAKKHFDETKTDGNNVAPLLRIE